jgi:inosose dehydratase
VSLRLATAPVTWGVWERTVDRDDLAPPAELLAAAASLGYRAIELGPPGYFGSDATAVRATLDGFELAGAFVELHLTDGAAFEADLAELERTLSILAGTSAVVLLAGTADRIDAAGRLEERARARLSGAALERAVGLLTRAAERCRERGVAAAIHPESGSYLEAPDEVEAFLERIDPGLAGVCLDTGHLTIGGGDAAALARDWTDRICHVHLKDVDADVLTRLRAGEVGLEQAWADGLFCPFGTGEVDLDGVVAGVRDFAGWAVLEQDRVAVRREDLPSVSAVERENLAYVRRLAGG